VQVGKVSDAQGTVDGRVDFTGDLQGNEGSHAEKGVEASGIIPAKTTKRHIGG
jgi:hypothetical protein